MKPRTNKKRKVENHSALLRVERILSPESNHEFRIIKDMKALVEVVGILKEMKKRIVLAQGVYDLYHIAHRLYLESAKAKGDILIVAIDSDGRTRKRKGAGRPLVPEDERLGVLVGTRAVDILTVRTTSQGKDDLVEAVRPDVLITSTTTADFTDEAKKYLESVCGEIITLPAQAPVSTTGRIRKTQIDGARDLKAVIDKALNEYFTGE